MHWIRRKIESVKNILAQLFARKTGAQEKHVRVKLKSTPLCQEVWGNFEIEDSPVPKDQVVPIYFLEVLVNRPLLDHIPDKKYYGKYKALLTDIPNFPSAWVHAQLEQSTLQFYCKCGCHSFFVFPYPSAANEIPGLPSFMYEIAFDTNYEEELNLRLFTDSNGLLNQVTIHFGQANLKPIPEDLQIGKLIGVWG